MTMVATRRRAPAPALAPLEAVELPWISVAGSYFQGDTGAAWTPIGYNDALTWRELSPLYGRKDVEAADRHLRWLAEHGVTVIRMMLECAHQGKYLERPIGRFSRPVVQFWDDLVALCSRHGLRLMLTPYDTFWTWIRWAKHPLNRDNRGPCGGANHLLRCRDTRQAVKDRLTFMVTRWGGSGVVMSWDLWNEIHPAHADSQPDSVDVMNEFIAEMSEHVRTLETRLYGRVHPQTVSMFGPQLRWSPELPLADAVYRHPSLDFATTHIYMAGSIDDPADTVAAAIDTGRLVRESLGEIRDGRPYLDTEHGPIHAFKDKNKTLPEAFDDEYFRHMQWAHLASGGAGGGMRWPNRKVHKLTPGMRRAQKAATGFLGLIDWPRFRRRNLNHEIQLGTPGVTVCGCGDESQAVAWLLRTDSLAPDGRVRTDAEPLVTRVGVPGLQPGRYSVVSWDTRAGAEHSRAEVAVTGDAGLWIENVSVATDLALAIRRME